MNETPFQNPRGGYFTMNDRGRLVAEKQHNPNNVHMGERYYSRQGPMGNPRLAGGYDSGNRRPIRDGQGNLVPQRPVFGEKFPRTPTPNYIPIMDYTGSRTAMNKGLDNWGGHRTNDGTFRLEGYGDQNIQQGGGQSDYDYDYDDFYDNVPYSPGMEGPLYFS